MFHWRFFILGLFLVWVKIPFIVKEVTACWLFITASSLRQIPSSEVFKLSSLRVFLLCLRLRFPLVLSECLASVAQPEQEETERAE